MASAIGKIAVRRVGRRLRAGAAGRGLGDRAGGLAGLAADAVGVLAAGRSLVVAGDFNSQAPGRVLRVGTDPGEDCAPTAGTCEGLCGAGGLDGYDDSIAILLGLDDSARLLSGDLDSTYVLRHFPGGAIDHVLVAGPAAAGFSEASTPPVSGKRWLGSDHRAVLTTNGPRR